MGTLRRTALAAALLAAFTVTGLAPVEAETPATIAGFVTDAQGQPVAGARIIFGDDTHAPTSEITDASGHYETQVWAGFSYRIYLDDDKQARYLSEFIRATGVTVPVEGLRIDHVATPGAVITGRLSTPSGYVPARRFTWGERIAGTGFEDNLQGSPDVMTGYGEVGADGTFTIRQVPPGTYRIAASDDCGGLGPVIQWFNSSSTNPSSGATYALAAGQSLTVDFNRFLAAADPVLTVKPGRLKATLVVKMTPCFRMKPTGQVKFAWKANGRSRTKKVSLTDGLAVLKVTGLSKGRQTFKATYLGSTTHHKQRAEAVVARVTG